jgi:hypothetical protein
MTAVGAAFAAPDDDASAPAGSMVIAVVIPDHGDAASPSPSPSLGGSADAEHLAGTGLDAAVLWPYALGGLAAVASGTAAVAAHRRRRPRT